MAEKIDPIILNDEILVRYAFLNRFKKGILDRKHLKDDIIFWDSRGGISMQRYRYCPEPCCKKLVLKIPVDFVGFIIFKQDTFLKVQEEFVKERPGFLAEITWSPIDDNNEYIEDPKGITDKSPGQPAHCDLNYISPGNIEPHNPRTVYRKFSKALFNSSTLIIDTEPKKPDVINYRFADAF